MALRAGTKGKQPSVQEGPFLRFLRSVGYKDELPPSTVSWLESAPVFKFLASRLSEDNFISPEEQQEYNEIQLAKGPDSEMYDILGDSGSEAGAENGSEQREHGEHLFEDLSDAELDENLQMWQETVEQLEKQIGTLKSEAGRVEASVRETRSKRPAIQISLQNEASRKLNAAKAALNKVNTEMNEKLAALSEVCADLATLLQDHPEQWLSSAADLSAYQQQDVAARQVFERAMRLLNAAGVVRQLNPTTPPAVTDSKQTPGKPAFQSALTTPQHHKASATAQQQQQMVPLLTPRGRGKINRAEALLDADIKRHADQEARNAALLRELTRQRLAFKVAFDDLLEAELAEQRVEAQLAIVQEVRNKCGSYARYLNMGADAVAQLSQEVAQLEERRQLLYREELPNLTEDLARLNDTFIVAGDYDRQLRKMAAATERKHQVLSSLVETTSRHMLLLVMGIEERQRLRGLLQELEATKNDLEGHADAVNSRINGCVAAQHALQQTQQRSNLQYDDSYLQAVTAAADGRLSFGGSPADGSPAADDEQQQVAAVAELGTPVGAAGAGNRQLTPQSARTPGYVPVKHVTDQLKQLSTNMQQGDTRLKQTKSDTDKHLDRLAAVDRCMYELAYPDGKSSAPLVPVNNLHNALHGSGGGGSSRGVGSVISSSAAPSIRSVRSAGSSAASGAGSGLHPLPLVRVPEVAELQAALEKANKQLGNAAQHLVHRQGEVLKVHGLHKHDTEAERKVLSWFYTNPQKLSAYVARLKEEIEALEAAQRIQSYL